MKGSVVAIEQDMVAAYRDGVHAARVGTLVKDNPFDPGHELASERLKAQMWVRGYGDGNPINIRALDLDEIAATVVHVPAHERDTPHGIEHVSAYDYDRETGHRIVPHPKGRLRKPGDKSSSSGVQVIHIGPQTAGTGAAGSGEPGLEHVDSSAPSEPRPGMHVATDEDHARLSQQGIKLPPAWTDVHISDDPSAALVAIGKDSKGRSQYVYSAEHSEKQSAAKFARINTLRSHIADVDHALASDASSSDDAAALMLIRRLGLRPGSDSDTGAEKKAYGATNLRAEHVSVNGDTVSLNFTGKKGVDLSFTVKDPHLAEVLAPRLEGKAPDDKVFNTNERKTADYFHSVAPGFKLKDLRTYHGTLHAFALVEGMPVPSSKSELAKARRSVAQQVSARLGNTPTVALASYIDPAVFAPWEGVGGDESSTKSGGS